MKLVVILLFELLRAFSADSQSCADDCKIVCGSDLPAVLTGPAGTLRRGKHGAKGQKGEVGLPGTTGLPGKDGADNSNVVAEISSTVQLMKEIVYRGLSGEIAKKCGLGMQDKNVVKDRQITCGSYHGNLENHSCKHARLFGRTGVSAWVAGYNTATLTNGVFHGNLWIQLDFESPTEVEGLITQGRETDNQWVTEFKVLFKEEGSDVFKTVLDEDGQTKIFEGNNDRRTPKTTLFKNKITARTFRIHVKSWHNYPALRFDFINC